eukprot:TRINITY_DN15104_c1_g1_i1.p1 TRINITY_DN15104_c1_g1~~TRINITY_DN15104_c1_g1_i1.p1  ORF type:complete len:380 (+),score=92.72 TRINITY_DN15104_c1_g1_i1:78-1217(+)
MMAPPQRRLDPVQCSPESLRAPSSDGHHGQSGMSGQSMPSLASSSSEQESTVRHGAPKINRQRRKTASGQTIVTTPWYPQGVLKDEIVLGAEVVALNRLLSLTDDERTVRNVCRSSVQEVVRQFWPDVTVKVYGSFAYDLSLPASALDLVCEGCADLAAHFPRLLDTLRRVRFTVEGSFASGSEAFARIHSPCGVTANVSFVPAKSLARQSVSLVRRLLSQFPAASAVFSAVRLILVQSKCNDPRNGGIASYALLLMVFHAAQSCADPADPGGLLLHFFRTFAAAAKQPDMVSATGGCRIDPKTAEGLKPGALWVEDPLDPANNVAQGCVRLPQIRSIFQTSAMTLDKWFAEKWAGYRGRTPLSSILAYGDLWERAGDK